MTNIKIHDIINKHITLNNFNDIEKDKIFNTCLNAIKEVLKFNTKITTEETSDFIITELKKLYNKYPELKIKYQCNNDYTHLIEIKPLNIFANDVDYIMDEAHIINKFNSLETNTVISFISDRALEKVNKPIFTIGYK